MEVVINRNKLGKKIKMNREKYKYTQFQLSCLIGVSPNFLGDIERGIKLPSLETLIKLCNTLKLSLDYLLADSLDNLVSEDDGVVYSDKQMAIIKSVIKSISDNF
ncbi:MAG: helix-turn-helix transcriptional regulator [Clostridia bacterium]|nr:helix-turn-helix transcriptional regulator [Clostridia bacterium]